ncbi:O-antigen ligase family protein [Hymenobacter perfusus]|nr:O-antigen ligase family protein [Hymenobacter perfusus]
MPKLVNTLTIGAYYRSGRLSQHLLWLACGAGVAGLLASRALIALSPVVGVLAVLANPQLRQTAVSCWRNGALLRAAALVAFLLLSGIYTSEWAVWRHELFRSLTWLGVPLAFTLAVPLSGRQRRAVGGLFVLSTAAVALATLAKYLLDPISADAAINVGHNVQAITGVFHIAFGTMLAQAFFWGLLLRRQQQVGPLGRAVLLAAAAVIVLTLHVLAYRTGLLVLYAGLLAYAIRLLLKKHVVFGLGLLALLALGPWVAFQTLHSVQRRVESTSWDIKQYVQGNDINDYSLARRLAAVETAASIIRRNWLVGVGPADAYAAMLDEYRWKNFGLRPANWVNVHNQYLSALIGGGVVGLAIWLSILFWPLRHRGTRRNPYIVFFILTQATVMMVADMLSLQIGLNLFVFGYGFLVVADETNRLRANRKLPD